MEDSNFQQFLKVLDDIELRNVEEIDGDVEKAAIEEEPSINRGSKRSKSTCTSMKNCLPPIRVRQTAQKRKVAKCILRQPGFVYRTKNLAKGTFLDNNLWEYTCRRRVLKSPSFKYRQTRKSALSPYSTRVIDSLSVLSIGVKSTTCQNPSPRTSLDLRQNGTEITQKVSPSSSNNNTYRFLPLSTPTVKSTSTPTSKIYFRPKQHPILPGKFKFLELNTTQEKSLNPHPITDRNTSNNWSTEGLCATFGDIPTTSTNGHFENAVWDGEKPGSKGHSGNSFFELRGGSLSETSRAQTTKKNQPKRLGKSCSYQARMQEHDVTVDELSSYVEDFLVLPQKMSSMAEMMYT